MFRELSTFYGCRRLVPFGLLKRIHVFCHCFDVCSFDYHKLQFFRAAWLDYGSLMIALFTRNHFSTTGSRTLSVPEVGIKQRTTLCTVFQQYNCP